MNYRQALDYLENSIEFGVKTDLDGIRHVLARSGDPHRRMKFVHITGTNGKGSTASFLASILAKAGHRVGLYTSPHLSDFRERIRANGKIIKKASVCSILERIRRITGGMKAMPSYFEVLTALSILYFEAERCDVSIMEVGLGGRLDSTNVVDGDVAVITGIAMDHTEYLGNTAEDIAREKTGIVKPGSTLVVNVPDDGLFKFIERQAYSRKAASVARVSEMVKGGIIFSKVSGTDFVTDSPTMPGLRATIPLVGDYQYQNAATAIAVIEVMKGLGLTRADAEAVREGFAATSWPGRFEFFGRKRRLVMDGAHNAQGMQCFTKNLRSLFPGKRIRSIVGIIASKDYRTMLDSVAEVSDEIIVCGLTNSPKNKNIDAENLYEYVRSRHRNVKIFPNPSGALDYAKKTIGADDIVCVTGSLYLVGEARGYVAKNGSFD